MAPQKVKIDWDRLDELLAAGCSSYEIASYFGIHRDSIYKRCLEDHGIKFTEYRQSKQAMGDLLLKEAQFNTALSGNVTMQIWLGKSRLGQREQTAIEVNANLSDLGEWLNEKKRKQQNENDDECS